MMDCMFSCKKAGILVFGLLFVLMTGVLATVPQIIIDSPTNSTYNTGDIWVNVTVLEGVVGTCNASGNGGPNVTLSNTTGNFNYWYPGFPTDYINSIEVYCGETATGDQNNTIVYWTSDVTGPVTTLIFPTNTSYNTKHFNLNWTAIDALSTVDVVMYSLDEGATNTTITDNTTFDLGSDGLNHLIIWSNDTVNNFGTDEVYFRADTTAPTLYLTSPLNLSYNTATIALEYFVSDTGTGVDELWYSIDDGANNYSFAGNTTFTPVQNSIARFRLWANDSVNNVAEDNIVFTEDNTAPALTLIYPTNTTYPSQHFNLNYTSIDTYGVSTTLYSLDEGVTNTTITDNTTFDLGSDGLKHLIIWSNDTTNNMSVDDVYFTADTTAPVLYLISPINISYKPSIPLNYWVQDVGIGVDELWYSVDEGVTNYSVTSNTTIATGVDMILRLRLWANDSYNNVAEDNIVFTVDNTAPVAYVIAPANTSYNSTTVTLNYFTSDSSPGVLSQSWYNIDDGTNVTLSGNTTFSTTEGLHKILVYANDTAGNYVKSSSTYFRIDVTSPSVYMILPANTTYNSTTVNISYFVNDSGSGISTVWYEFNFTNTTIAANGTFTAWDDSHNDNNITLWVNDSAGNIGHATLTYFSVDTSAPTVDIIGPTNTTYTSSNTLDFKYFVSDSVSSVDDIWYHVTSISNNMTLTANTSLVLANGFYKLELWANDTVNNVGVDTVYFTISKSSTTYGGGGGYAGRSNCFGMGVKVVSAIYCCSQQVNANMECINDITSEALATTTEPLAAVAGATPVAGNAGGSSNVGLYVVIGGIGLLAFFVIFK